MTIRQYTAILFGTLLIAFGLFLVPLPALAAVDEIGENTQYAEVFLDITELEPALSGFHEDDDMPSYLAWDRPEFETSLTYAPAPQRQISFANTDRSVLAADGPIGLSWDILVRLSMLSILFFAVAFYGVRKNA